jgi:preprotein translocase subunit SecA
MGFLNVVTNIFGAKADRDLKEVQPIVEKIIAVYQTLSDMSNDDLRAMTNDLKQRIQDSFREEREKIKELKALAEEKDIYEREDIYEEVDAIEQKIDDNIEESLDEILPEAFAIMRETARRFKENEEIVVTANDFDRDLAANKDYLGHGAL